MFRVKWPKKWKKIKFIDHKMHRFRVLNGGFRVVMNPWMSVGVECGCDPDAKDKLDSFHRELRK